MLLFFLFCLFSAADFFVIQTNNKFSLNIVHVNDFHARFEETDESGGLCRNDKCIGGFSRLYYQINQMLKENPEAILLNAGDNFRGTLWYTVHRWNVTQYFMNKLPFDAITLGNHEFDDKIAGLRPYIVDLKSPVVVANIDASEEPDFQGIFTKSIIVERNGKKIGIIGVLTKSTQDTSRPEKLKILDESASVNAEAERLADKVDTIIILSHCGYDVEKEMAKNATAKVGLIIGGHSHTFLYSGEPSPGPEKPGGPYPTIVKRKDGGTVLVTQASAYCRYLGNITVFYNEQGEVEAWEGSPIYLDHSIPQDNYINEELLPWKQAVDEKGKRIIGTSKVLMESSKCLMQECLLGNFITDVMSDYFKTAETNFAPIAFITVDSLKGEIEIGNITFNDLSNVQPYENTFDLSDLKGKVLKELFEYIINDQNINQQVNINFLQVSGLKLVFDLKNKEGNRVSSIKVFNKLLQNYEEVQIEETYKIVTPSFITSGGGGRFSIVSKNIANKHVGDVDTDVIEAYMKINSPISESISKRILFI